MIEDRRNPKLPYRRGWGITIRILGHTNTAIISGMVLAGAFIRATFIHTSLIERLLISLSSFCLGWYFSRQYYEVDAAVEALQKFKETKNPAV